MILHKRRLRRIWQTTRSPLDKTNFNRASNNLKKALLDIKNCETAKFLHNINAANDNAHSLWKATKYLKRPAVRNIPIKKDDGTWCRSNKNKADLFSEHLEQTFKSFPATNSAHEKNILEFLDMPCQMDLPIKPCTFIEVKNEIRRLNNSKSPGYEKIDSMVAKNLPDKAVLYLTLIYNSILKLSHYPTQWKCAEIIMIPKPNKPENNISSYRPISLLPLFSKIFERIVSNRLTPILERHNIIPDHQFGFRHKHGTPEQCHRIVNVITDAFERKLYCSAVFLDVKQAFDRVWHQGLLFKLKAMLPAPFYLLLKSYLEKRSFYVRINDEYSEIRFIYAGVPQGSVLGPILYTIYSADMPIYEKTTIATYADDTAIIASDESPITASSYVQNELNLLQKWFEKWKITINTEKSRFISFTLRRKDCPPVFVNNAQIPKSENVKYLGMHLDKRLNWKQHISAKRNHLNMLTKKLHWLLGHKSALDLRNKLLIYKAILKPVWTYGIQLWGTTSSSNLQILQRYQSKTLRLIVNAPWFVSNKSIHKDLDIPLVIDEIRKFSANYLQRLGNHSNILAIALLDETEEIKRLKRIHILDLPYRK